jgi:hypothetical protein
VSENEKDHGHDPEFKAWAAQVADSLIPMMNNSEVVVSLAPEGETDIKYAVELGLSIMMDKPIIVVAMPGQPLPVRLHRVADAIVYTDISTEQGRADLNAVLEHLHSLDEGEMEPVPHPDTLVEVIGETCPECAQKKCRNCDGTTWSNQLDAYTICACAEKGHQV